MRCICVYAHFHDARAHTQREMGTSEIDESTHLATCIGTCLHAYTQTRNMKSNMIHHESVFTKKRKHAF
jgi:hypothetical protein